MGDGEAVVEVDARTAELVVEALGSRVTGDGFIALEARISNEGELPADSVVVTANWVSADGERSGAMERAGTLERLGPNESDVLSLPIAIPTGAYTLALGVQSETLESVRDDNFAETRVEVDYVQLSLEVASVKLLGYEMDGDGVVEVLLRVTNEGKASSGEFVIGVVCADDTGVDCSQTLSLESILPGAGAEGVLEVVAPQGESVARAFASGDDDGYRWGADNVETLIIDVPSKLATELTLSAEFEVTGYWPDGTADVELAATLLNEGYSRLEGAQQASFTCRQEDEAVSGCEGEVEASLTDGFASDPQTLTVRVPMSSLNFDFDLGSEEPMTLAFDVPRRIVGVSREVWECFSDRPGIWEDDAGCGGWYSDTVVKWPQDKPVKVWVTGDSDYIRVFEETLEELSPLLNLDFEWTADEEEADLKAYVGVPTFRAGGTPLDCPENLGCANWDFDDGVVSDGVVSVWLDERKWRRELGVLQDDIRHLYPPPSCKRGPRWSQR